MTFPHPLVMIPLRHCGGYEFLSFKNEKTDLQGVLLQTSTEYLISRHSMCINFTTLIIKVLVTQSCPTLQSHRL